MDKGIAKSVLHDHGLPVAAGVVARRVVLDSSTRPIGRALDCPLFVKPANLGPPSASPRCPSGRPGRRRALAFEFDDHVILEECIDGRELELAVMGNEEVRVSRAGEIVASREFYDDEDKYVLGLAETIVSMESPTRSRTHGQRVAQPGLLGPTVEGLARVDLFLRRRRDRRQRGQYHAGLHADLHVPHALGVRRDLLPRRGRRAGRSGPGPAHSAADASHPAVSRG